jgi:hypothetical protein
MAAKLPLLSDRNWAAMTLFVVCCTARQFDRQVSGIEIELCRPAVDPQQPVGAPKSGSES